MRASWPTDCEVIENAGELGPRGPDAAEGRITRSDAELTKAH